MMHLAVRDKSAAEHGHLNTAAIDTLVIERLTKSFPGGLGDWRPA